jgi:hypothetical protein
MGIGQLHDAYFGDFRRWRRLQLFYGHFHSPM